jgi:DNA adenine methylase
MNTLINYIGNKRKMATTLVDIIRSISHCQYAEPYAGSAAVFFAKGRPDVGSSLYLEHLNDINANLMTAYRTMQDPIKREQVVNRLHYTLYSNGEWNAAASILQSDEATDIDITWALVVAHNQAFAGSPNTGWARSIMRKKPMAPNLPLMWQSRIGDAFEESLGRLRWASIHNEDALSFIKRVDSPFTLFYVDPPYVGTKPGKGYDVHTPDDWRSLQDTLASVQGSWVLTSYETIDISYDKHVELDSSTSLSRSSKGSSRIEHVWVKYAVE